MSGLLNTIKNQNTTIDVARLDENFEYLYGRDKILQVVQTVKTDTFSMTGLTWTDITGFTVNITPIFATSKILIMGHINIGCNTFNAYTKLVRNATDIYIGDVASTRPRVTGAFGLYSAGNEIYGTANLPFMYLDSPATSTLIQYKMQLRQYSAGNLAYVNRTHADRDTADYDPRIASSIMVMEVAV